MIYTIMYRLIMRCWYTLTVTLLLLKTGVKSFWDTISLGHLGLSPQMDTLTALQQEKLSELEIASRSAANAYLNYLRSLDLNGVPTTETLTKTDSSASTTEIGSSNKAYGSPHLNWQNTSPKNTQSQKTKASKPLRSTK